MVSIKTWFELESKKKVFWEVVEALSVVTALIIAGCYRKSVEVSLQHSDLTKGKARKLSWICFCETPLA